MPPDMKVPNSFVNLKVGGDGEIGGVSNPSEKVDPPSTHNVVDEKDPSDLLHVIAVQCLAYRIIDVHLPFGMVVLYIRY